MKTPFLHLRRALCALPILSVGLLALPQDADANRYSRSSSPYYSSPSSYWGAPSYRYRPSSRPRSGFSFSIGTGFSGRSYSPGYYGSTSPSFSNRSSYSARSVNASVQQALARRGYYRGSIDGIIGSQSRSAIFRYQQDRRLQATGTITPELLRSLGL